MLRLADLHPPPSQCRLLLKVSLAGNLLLALVVTVLSMKGESVEVLYLFAPVCAGVDPALSLHSSTLILLRAQQMPGDLIPAKVWCNTANIQMKLKLGHSGDPKEGNFILPSTAAPLA